MIDLHTHSTASDGTLTPAELIGAASEMGLAAIALTDHDTVAGVGAALAAADAAGLRFLPGVEISANASRTSVHIVGLGVDHESRALVATLDRLARWREDRNEEMSRRLAAARIDLPYEAVVAHAGGDVVGRPHFAELLVAGGHAASWREAFDRYLSPGGIAYVEKRRLDAADAMRAIRGAGGVPVLAHPGETRLEGGALDDLVGELAGQGLAGLEVYCSGHTPGQVKRYRRLARRHGLVLSGGSDLHGAIKPAIALGRGPGRLFVPDDLLAPILERAAEISRSGSARG
jgi:predicted metal-dependent phosphoesterase TrpH